MPTRLTAIVKSGLARGREEKRKSARKCNRCGRLWGEAVDAKRPRGQGKPLPDACGKEEGRRDFKKKINQNGDPKKENLGDRQTKILARSNEREGRGWRGDSYCLKGKGS